MNNHNSTKRTNDLVISTEKKFIATLIRVCNISRACLPIVRSSKTYSHLMLLSLSLTMLLLMPKESMAGDAQITANDGISDFMGEGLRTDDTARLAGSDVLGDSEGSGTPYDPTDPADPESPEDPEAPTDPDDPNSPDDPNDPNKPNYPDKGW